MEYVTLNNGVKMPQLGFDSVNRQSWTPFP